MPRQAVYTLSLALRGCPQTADLLALARGPDGAFAAYDVSEASGYADFRPTRFGLAASAPLHELPGVATLRATSTASH